MLPNIQIMPKSECLEQDDRDYFEFEYDDLMYDDGYEEPSEDPEDWTDEDEAGLEEYEIHRRERIALQWEDDKYWE